MDAKTNIKAKLPSRHVTEGPDRAPHRSYYYAMGLTTAQIHQPFVGVATCWNEAAPCNIALMRRAQAAKKGVAAAGATRGFCVGHVGPEAAVGGPIALVRDGDIIEIDAVKGTINVKVSDAELTKRRKAWKPKAGNVASGYIWKYAQQVGDALHGAVTHPGGAA